MYDNVVLVCVISIIVAILGIWIYFICKGFLSKINRLPKHRDRSKSWLPSLSGMQKGVSSEAICTVEEDPGNNDNLTDNVVVAVEQDDLNSNLNSATHESYAEYTSRNTWDKGCNDPVVTFRCDNGGDTGWGKEQEQSCPSFPEVFVTDHQESFGSTAVISSTNETVTI